jgi:hypothetical protein
VRAGATYDPELLVAPPVLNANATPPQLEDTCQDDGGEEAKKPYCRSIGELY